MKKNDVSKLNPSLYPQTLVLHSLFTHFLEPFILGRRRSAWIFSYRILQYFYFLFHSTKKISSLIIFSLLEWFDRKHSLFIIWQMIHLLLPFSFFITYLFSIQLLSLLPCSYSMSALNFEWLRRRFHPLAFLSHSPSLSSFDFSAILILSYLSCRSNLYFEMM